MIRVERILKDFFYSRLNYGTNITESDIDKKLIFKLNAICYGLVFYMLILSLVNIVYNNNEILLLLLRGVLILFLSNVIFRLTKKIVLYVYVLAFCIIFIICYTLITSAYFGSSLISVGICIIALLNILNLKLGIIASLFIIVFEIFIWLLNSKLPWIQTYPALINKLFIRFIVAHLGILIFSIININKQQELFIKVKKEKEEKESLFINLVHDLKTPLTLMHNNIDKLINSDDKDTKINLKFNISQMEKNILNILNIEKIERGLGLFESANIVNISKISNDICVLFYDYITDNNVNYNYDIDENVCINIDKESFIQIIINIIENSIKFTKPGDSINFSLIKYTKVVRIIIEDTGAGIPEEKLNKVFEKYYQENKGYRSNYGLGLGLPIVKNLCNIYNGSIKLESVYSKGTKTIIEFPATKKKAIDDNDYILKNYYYPISQKELKPETTNDKLNTILVVEDNFDIRGLLTKELRNKYNVISAKNGLEALNYCKLSCNIDLIVTDVMMPEIDGEKFILKLRNELKNLITPVIFISAMSGLDKSINYISLGAIDYISKPFSVSEVLKKVDSIIELIKNRDKSIVDRINKSLTNFVSENYSHEFTDVMKHLPNSNNLRKFDITNKEEQIIVGIWGGLTKKEIADKNKISINTVKTHIYKIYKKCDVNNTTSLIKLFYNYK